MPLTDADRLLDEALQPRVVTLRNALARLTSTVSFMSTGAHPDDEISAMLAALGRRDGLDLSYACATRGEGGQNDIGTESGHDLGTLRSAEMERASAILDMRLYWLSESPEDSISDFGFSKSGQDTLQRWGSDRTLHRFVTIVRTERPDILCPTFLDVPGQHGHHRAMTAVAHRVMDAAADTTLVTPGLAPWQPKKLYLPAFGGAGNSYDDELPPPPATMTIQASGRDPVTGSSWERLGQLSRRMHRTQGMGRWVSAGSERDWPLHLADTRTSGPDDALHSGLPATLGELADWCGADQLIGPLADAQSAIEGACANAVDDEAVLRYATDALVAVRLARRACPAHARTEVLHRLARKEQQIARVIRLAANVDVRARLTRDVLRPGESSELEIDRHPGSVTVAVALKPGKGFSGDTTQVQVDATATPTDPYPVSWLPDSPRLPALSVSVTSLGQTSVGLQALETPPLVLPATSVNLSPQQTVLNLASGSRAFPVRIVDVHPADAEVSLDLPHGWRADRVGDVFTITTPDAPTPDLYPIPASVDGRPARSIVRIEHAHLQPLARAPAASVSVRVVDIALPNARIAYVGGGNDRVAEQLRSIGLVVQELDDSQLANNDGLAGFDTLVVGLFAMRTRPALAQAMPRVHAWVEAGGHLLTLYHRPWDGWDPDAIPVRPLSIGQPSLRWRVTDERSDVEHLDPAHALLNTPNVIGPADWRGWHKERGLYFANHWDETWQPLLSMADPDEQALHGALLVCDAGAGRHVHTSLILHHQMAHLVPGAFRLMANLVS